MNLPLPVCRGKDIVIALIPQYFLTHRAGMCFVSRWGFHKINWSKQPTFYSAQTEDQWAHTYEWLCKSRHWVDFTPAPTLEIFVAPDPMPLYSKVRSTEFKGLPSCQVSEPNNFWVLSDPAKKDPCTSVHVQMSERNNSCLPCPVLDFNDALGFSYCINKTLSFNECISTKNDETLTISLQGHRFPTSVPWFPCLPEHGLPLAMCLKGLHGFCSQLSTMKAPFMWAVPYGVQDVFVPQENLITGDFAGLKLKHK